MSRLEAVFAEVAEEDRAAFIPYLTGGDPDLGTASELVATLVDSAGDGAFGIWVSGSGAL